MRRALNMNTKPGGRLAWMVVLAAAWIAESALATSALAQDPASSPAESAQRAQRAQQALSSAEARLYADRLIRSGASKLAGDRAEVVAAAGYLASAESEIAKAEHAAEEAAKLPAPSP